MKIIIFLLMLFGVTTLTHAQVSKLDLIFDKYQQAKGVTSIKIGKPMFNMINKLDIGEEEMEQIKPLLTKINSIKMLIVEDNDSLHIQDEVKQAFANIHYEELMAIHSGGSRIKFLAESTGGDVVKNLLLDISEDGSKIFMILDGMINYADINQLVKEK